MSATRATGERVDQKIGHNLYDVHAVRRDFPILRQEVNGHPLVYLDNGATSQKPQSVIDAVRHYYECDNANVHRGVHALSERATNDYEASRDTAQRFINAADRGEVILVRSTTEGINLVAQSYGRPQLHEGDEIIISTMEHHSNIVPWQMLAEQTGAVVKVIPISDEGELDMNAYLDMLSPKTRIVAVVHVSNALGTINPVKAIIDAAHDVGAVTVIDGAQAAPHLAIDVQALDSDFYTFSGHKVFGPTGIGVLHGKRALLEKMEPYQGGGDMIRTVSFDGTTYNELPYKFEAGTPNIAGAIGLGAALEYVGELGLDAIAAHEHDVLEVATATLGDIPGVRLIGTAREKSSIVSFVVDGVHAHDVGTVVDSEGVAIRTGHHCAMPLMQRYGIAATARASFALYNTREEVETLAAALWKVKEMFGK